MVMQTAAWLSSWISWHSLTWFGDSNLLLPAGAALALAIFASSETRKFTFRWMFAFGATGSVVLVSKVAFLAWGWGNESLDFTGFSGHTALSACFWPVLAWFTFARCRRPTCLLAIGAAYLLALGIAVSRLMLEAHSTSEVVFGGLLGSAASLWFLKCAWDASRPKAAMAVVPTVFMVVVTVALHGKPAPTTHLLERSVMHVLGVSSLYTRHDLRLRMHRL